MAKKSESGQLIIILPLCLKKHGSACKNTALGAESVSDIPTAVFSAKFVPSCGGGMEETK